MSAYSSIEWTEATWNPVTGCSKVSKGCKNCYAERFALRLQAAGHPHYVNGFKLTTHHDALKIPLMWRKPRLVFVCSMSDLFHEEVPLSFIRQVFDVMRMAKHHTFQVLTKRPSRLAGLAGELPWSDNVWAGVTVESSEYLSRANDLRTVPAKVKFLSLEPLLGPIPHLPLQGIQWVIVGGESGPSARPMSAGWVRDIRDQCSNANVAFFFKQWGGLRKRDAGRLLDGRTWDEVPHGTARLQSAPAPQTWTAPAAYCTSPSARSRTSAT
ncbi:MAG: phage Gp37/Gp68 family protein [Bacillota bacterium]